MRDNFEDNHCVVVAAFVVVVVVAVVVGSATGWSVTGRLLQDW